MSRIYESGPTPPPEPDKPDQNATRDASQIAWRKAKLPEVYRQEEQLRQPIVPVTFPQPDRNVRDRIRGWDHKTMADNPQVTAWVVGRSGMSDEEARHFGRGFKVAADYVAKQDRFAGVDYGLSALRRRVMKINDPAVRGQGLIFLNNMANMTPERQQQLLALLTSTNARGRSSVHTYTQEQVGLLAEAAPEGAVTGGIGGDAYMGQATGFELANTNLSTDLYAALKTLFPELNLGLDADAGYTIDNAWEDIANFQDDLTDKIYDSSGGVRSGVDILDEYQRGERSAAATFLPLVGSITAAPAEVGTRFLGDAGRSNVYTRDLTESADRGFAIVQEEISKKVEPVIAFGLDPEAPDYEEQLRQRMGAFALLAALAPIGIGRVAGKIKIVRTAVSREAAEAALGAKYRVPKPDPGILDKALTAARAPATAVGRRIDQQVLKFARDPEAWFTAAIHGRQGRKLLDNIDAARAAFPDDPDGAVGYLHAIYGDQIPARFARQLVTAGSRDAAMRVFIDTVTNKPGRGVISGLNREAIAAERAVAEQADRIETARRNGVPPEGSVVDMPLSEVDGFADPELWDPNTQMHPDGRGKLTRDQFDALKRDIEENGIQEPLDIRVDPKTGMALMDEGFHRWQAATDLGMESVPVRVVYDTVDGGTPFTPIAKRIDELERKLDDAVNSRVETIPTEVHGTQVAGPDGEPTIVYHGTTSTYDTPDVSASSELSQYGPGYYTTEARTVASGYAGGRTRLFGTEAEADSHIRFYGNGRKTQLPSGDWEVRLVETQVGSPQVRRSYLNIRNPFDIDAPTPVELLDSIEAALPEGMGARFRTEWESTSWYSLRGTNEEVYRALTEVFDGDKAAVNRFLKEQGFDGIKHKGGRNTGTPSHQVWIAFDGEQVFPAFQRVKLDDVLALTKELDDAKAALRKANPEIAVGDLQELARRRMEVDRLNYRIATTFDDSPMLTLPNQSVIRSIVRQPTTAFERAVHSILNKSHVFGEGQLLDLAKTVDELATHPRLYVAGRPDNPPGWREHNASQIETYMRRAGVDARTAQKRVGELSGAQTDAEFYDILEHRIFGEGGDIDLALGASRTVGPDGKVTITSKLDPELRAQLISLHDNPVETRTRSLLFDRTDTPAGKGTVTTHVLGKEVAPGQVVPAPSRPTEFLDNVTLPNVDKIIEANSMLRKVMREGRKHGGSNLAVKAFWDIPRAIAHVSTLLGKPLVMIVRLPAMAMRIQMEQGLRSSQFGYKPFKGFPDGLSLLPGGIPIPGTNHSILSGLFGEDGWKLLAPDPRFDGLSRASTASEMGMFMEIQDTARPERVLEDTADLNARRAGRTPSTRHYEAVREELDLAHQDWLDREIGRRLMDNPNLEPDEILQWILGKDSRRQFLEGNMDPQLRQSTLFSGDLDAARTAWLQNRISYVRQITGGDSDLLHVVGHGRLKGGVQAPIEQQLRYRASVRETTELGDEIKRVKREEPPSPEREAKLTAMYGERKIEWERQRRMRRQYEGVDGKPVKKGRKGAKSEAHAKREIRDEIKAKFEAGSYNFPDRIQVARRWEQKQEGATIWDDLDRYTQGVSATMYRGLRPLSYIDRHGTRGSLFTQSQAKWRQQLEKFGYSPKEAQAIAYVKAGKETTDLMYDLNARTSFQRASKDIFWFAPATQEVLYTWLVKIPSQQYWPIGIASLASKALLLRELMRRSGLVQKDQNGEDIIMVKPVSRLLDALLPGEVPEFSYGKVSGLNLVTSGGAPGVPGLSVMGNFALGKAALKWGGPFKALSDFFQPYGPEASVLPQPINFLHEAVFGEAPPWEFLAPDYQKAQWDRTVDMGVQYAYSELASEGILPPKPEDYGTYNKSTKRWVLSPDQEEAFKTANKAYLEQLFGLGKEYAQGQAWVRLMGSTVAPMSLYTTSQDREDWMKFWNEVIVPKGFGDTGYSEEQSDLIEHYLQDHPGSMGYATFYSQRNEPNRTLPFAESEDDAFFDAYYTGEVSTMKPEDYSRKLMATESRRFYQNQLGAKLREISPNDDPWELLTQGFEKTEALQDYKDKWERYKFLNPEAAVILDQQSRLWRESQDMPSNSWEAERTGDALTALKAITPMLTGESGIRPQFVRETMAELQKLYSEQGEFGAPTTEREKAMGWWFDNVMSPYVDKTAKLYEEADRLTALGQDASPIYDQIRALSNEAPPTYKGQQVPSVEEVFFGNKSPEEQQAAVNAWTTRPIEWLSDFQREKVGYKISPEDAKFLDDYAQLTDLFYGYTNAEGLTPGSNAYARAERRQQLLVQGIAAQAGPSALELLRLTQAAPVERLAYMNYGANSQGWADTVNLARLTTGYIEGEHMSVKGYSVDVALPAKVYFYQSVNAARANDPQLDQLLDDLSMSLPLPGGQYREGALLYEAVFFGNFRTTDIPDTLTSIGDGSSYG